MKRAQSPWKHSIPLKTNMHLLFSSITLAYVHKSFSFLSVSMSAIVCEPLKMHQVIDLHIQSYWNYDQAFLSPTE